jgi:hypothetical protein
LRLSGARWSSIRRTGSVPGVIAYARLNPSTSVSSAHSWKFATVDWMALLFTLPMGSSRSYVDRSMPIQPDMNTSAPSSLA